MIRGPRVVAAEVALLGVSLAVVYGFGRLFSASDWVVPLVLTALGTHLLSAVARRMRLGIVVQVLVVALGLLLLLGWSIAPDTLRWGLPTRTTLDALGDAVSAAVTEYPDARAPVEPVDGFVLLSMVGVALVALMANVAAFVLRAPLQALVPPFTLFALCSVLGSGEMRVGAAVAFVVTSLAFVLAMRGIDATTATTWLPGDDRRGPDALMRLGAALVATSAVAAAVVGPALPGSAEEGLWTWRGGGGPSARFVVSPLVDIQARLVNQSRQIAFTVRSPQPAYWRLMALDDFDGQRWRVSTNFRPVDGSFGMITAGSEDRTIEQRIEIRGLDSEYLPAAYAPIFVDAGDERVTWDDRSSTLLLDRRAGDGFSYVARSVLPAYSAEQLRAAESEPPRSVAARYLQLPALDPRVAELAASLTAGAATDYDRVLALQTFFREEFTYSLEIEGGSGDEALLRFLFDDRRGYCEQFAASFAAMARTLGIPSRVAVGFTEGEPSEANPDFYTVRGADAHAWPEIYFTGLGWVPFEPTPGRITPGGEAWTTLAEAPEEVDEETSPTSQPPSLTDPTLPEGFEEELFPELDGGTGGTTAGDEGVQVPAVVRWALTAVAVVAGWVVLVSALVRLRRSRRRSRATDPSARVLVAWTEVVEAMARRGRTPRVEETYLEYADRVALAAPSTADQVRELASLATTARYSSEQVPDDDVARAVELAHRVVRTTTRRMPWWQRLLHRADPRVLMPARPRRSRQRATVVAAG